MATSRLLTRLDAAISRTRDPVRLACLRAERAGLLARHGQVGLARTQLQDIQRQFAREPHVAVSGWLALAEGQIDHYSRLGGTAHDRFLRAYALSRAAQLTPLQALAAAWLAHSEDVRHQRGRMAALCAEALRLAEPDHHAARWRASLTVAGAYHFAGRLDLAQPWYAAARSHAMADGDEMALSALMFNQAALRGIEARFAAAFDGQSDAHAAAILGADAADSYDAAMGLQSLDWLLPLVRAQLLVLDGRWQDTLQLIDRHLPRADAGWRERMQASLLADRAWCVWQLGGTDEARRDAQAAEQALQGPCDVDDRALAQARLAQLLQALGDGARAQTMRERAERDARTHREDQQALRLLLDEALAGVQPG